MLNAEAGTVHNVEKFLDMTGSGEPSRFGTVLNEEEFLTRFLVPARVYSSLLETVSPGSECKSV